MHSKKYLIYLSSALFFLTACSSKKIIVYPNEKPMLVDNDKKNFSKRPKDYYSPKLWDFFDHNMMRPMTHSFLLRTKSEARNVNSLDEVPNSSWFTNRIGTGKKLSLDDVAKGSCDNAEAIIHAPWEVISGKPNGANPGFLVKDSSGKKFMLKFDGLDQPEAATAADVIGSKIYHAAGYYSPCNKVVYFNPNILKISPKAKRKNKLGNKIKMTQKDIEKAMSNTVPLKNGTVRASISEFLPGRPLGPWKYQGTREDDPNDVIEHQHRRELRGGKVIASWLNHFDAREQNSLSIWVKDKKTKKGHVGHYYLDFGDCLGSLWSWDGVSRRHGSSYYLDPGHIFEDLMTFGLKERPWHNRTYGRTGVTLGYFDVDHFNAERWHNGYRNPAFDEATEYDSAWMARIIANFTDEHVDRIVDEGKIQNKFLDKELRRILKGRRDKILFRWLKTLSPLTNAYLKEGSVCLKDLAVSSQIVDPTTRRYDAFIWNGPERNYLGRAKVSKANASSICIDLKKVFSQNAKNDYFTLEVVATNVGRTDHGHWIKPNRPPLRLHFYRNKKKINIVALERDKTPNFKLPLTKYSNLLQTNHYYNDGSPDMTIGEVPD